MLKIISPDTEWKFLPSASPHMERAWGRLIQSVNNNLAEMKPGRNPTDSPQRANRNGNIDSSQLLTYVLVDDPDAPYT